MARRNPGHLQKCFVDRLAKQYRYKNQAARNQQGQKAVYASAFGTFSNSKSRRQSSYNFVGLLTQAQTTGIKERASLQSRWQLPGLGSFEPRKPLIEDIEFYEDKGVEYFVKRPGMFQGQKDSKLPGGGDSAGLEYFFWPTLASEVTLSIEEMVVDGFETVQEKKLKRPSVKIDRLSHEDFTRSPGPDDMNMNIMELVRAYELAPERTIGVLRRHGYVALPASVMFLNNMLCLTMGDDEEAMLSEAFFCQVQQPSRPVRFHNPRKNWTDWK
ncbi:hypothetical protein FQR65_LT19593 [Abscondita terminalis]|nr:hypothetical protein FQR65_LT19593 [Abscondita terminalis]